DHDPLPDTFIRLQPDDKLIGMHFSGRLAEDRVRYGLELDDDLRNPGSEALACPQIEGHAGPAPVLEPDLQRDEGFRPAVAQFGLGRIALDRFAPYRSGPILPAHGSRSGVAAVDRRE